MQMTIECIRDVLDYIAKHQHFKNETINKDKNVKYKFVRLGEYTLIQDLIKTKGTKTYTEEDIAYTITCLIDGGYLFTPHDDAKEYRCSSDHSIFCLSYQGDEFYKSIAPPTVWKQIEEKFANHINPPLTLLLNVAKIIISTIK